MIVGNGDIASVLPDRDDFLFFASGVSNSREDRESEYEREINLLLAQDPNRRLVYFSSLAIFYANTRYTRHKLEMEKWIENTFPSYTIVRIGNITWGDNPHTIINYFRNKIKAKQDFEIKDEYRFIVDKEEFLYWIDKIPHFNCEMNITGLRLKVADIVKRYGYA